MVGVRAYGLRVVVTIEVTLEDRLELLPLVGAIFVLDVLQGAFDLSSGGSLGSAYSVAPMQSAGIVTATGTTRSWRGMGRVLLPGLVEDEDGSEARYDLDGKAWAC